MNDIEKLRALLPHWIEHNEEHAENFRRWAEKARHLGLEEVADLIEEAAEKVRLCNEALAEALRRTG